MDSKLLRFALLIVTLFVGTVFLLMLVKLKSKKKLQKVL